MNTFLETENIKRGCVIHGRWEGNSYRILQYLGHGGSGSVYLAEDKVGSLRALKISADPFAITSEYRVLVFLKSRKEINQLQIVPRVYEIDDFQIGSNVYHFIAMEYCKGQNLRRFAGRLNLLDTVNVGQKVGEFLAALHRTGFIFGDLKPGNIIYDFDTRTVRVIDFGSVTMKGTPLKQFTPGYDRESWQAGDRNADENYDVFSLGLLIVTMLLGKIHHKKDGVISIIARIKRKINNHKLQRILLVALNQKLDCREISCQLAELAEDLAETSSDISNTFVNLIGLASAASFIFSLIYLHGLN